MYDFQSEFIEQMVPLIQKNIKEYGFGNGAVILSQAILESDWGRSRLAAKHNYFGIKAPSTYNGETLNGFMVWSTREEGVKGYFELMTKPRYQGIRSIQNESDYIDELIRSGYCDDYGYKEQLLQIINSTVYAIKERFPKIKKPVTWQVIKDVANGRYGNSPDRAERLETEGYDAEKVRRLVNFYLGHQEVIGKVAEKLLPVAEFAKEQWDDMSEDDQRLFGEFIAIALYSKGGN